MTPIDADQTDPGSLPERERDRQTLLHSAAQVIASRGIAGARIVEITDRVGLSDDTFHDHFQDKDSVVRAVALEAAERITGSLDADMASETDAAVRVVTATRRAITTAVNDPGFGLLLVETLEQLPEMRGRVLRHLSLDVTMGITQGEFDVEVTPYFLDQMMTLVVLSMRTQIRNGHDEKTMAQTCEALLRLCGMPPEAARRAVQRAQPESAATSRNAT